ncbi:hypothetical protein, partial [Phocaeicola vulgatus]|uniref:hypothetical protein n=1 Tax=Phocaeicola vulgatus TaxID=821 RepID=UPI00210CFE56
MKQHTGESMQSPATFLKGNQQLKPKRLPLIERHSGFINEYVYWPRIPFSCSFNLSAAPFQNPW